MTIRSRLRLLSWGSLLTIALATLLWWRGHQLVHADRERAAYIEQLRGAAMSLHAMTLDLVYDDAMRLATKQWRAIHARIGARLRDTHLSGIPNQTLLLDAHARIGQRFERYLQVREECRQTGDTPPRPGCASLLRRLTTQLRLAMQDLFIEIGRAESWANEHLDHSSSIVTLLMLSLIALLTLSTTIIVWPMTRRLNQGLSQLLTATERLGRGDLAQRLPVAGDDEITRLSATYNQMADQRQISEERLRQKEQWLSTLLDTLPHGVQESNPDGIITYSNLAHHRLLGLKPGELSGRAIWDFIPDDNQKRQLRKKLARLRHEQPEPRPFVIDNLSRDGRRITFEIDWNYQRDEHGNLKGFLSIVSDVTARVRAERALQASEASLSEAQGIAHIGSWTLDLPDGGLRCSPELTRIFELEPDCCGDPGPLLARVHPADRLRVMLAYRRSVKQQRPYDIVHRLAFGTRIKYIHERGHTEYDSAGHALRSLGTAQDITDRILAEQRLQYRLYLEGALARVSSLLARADDQELDSVIDTALRTIGRAVSADRAYLFQLNDDGDHFDNTHEWCDTGIPPQQQDLQQVPVADYEAAFKRFRGGRVLNVSSADHLDDDLAPLREFMLATGLRSLLNVPVINAGHLLGVIGFDAMHHARDWPEADIQLLRTVSESLGGVLARQEANRRIQEHTRYLEGLDRVSRLIAGNIEPRAMLDELTTLLLELFDTDRAWLLCAETDDAPGYRIEIEAIRPGSACAKPMRDRLPAGDTMRTWVQELFDRGEVAISHFGQHETHGTQSGIRSQMSIAIPAYAQRRCILCLLHCTGRRDWTATEKRLFKAIAERLAPAWASGELVVRLQDSQRRLLEAERIARTGSWELTLPERHMYWSRQECRCLGLDPACEPSLNALLAQVHEKDRGWVGRAFESLLNGQRKHLDIQHRISTESGGERIVHQLAISERNAAGDITRLIGTTQDISERMLLERELDAHRKHLETLVAERTATIRRQAQIIEQTNDAVITTDLEGIITSWNRGAERLFGYSAEQAVGQSIDIIHTSEDRPSYQWIITQLEDKNSIGIEGERRRRDGSRVPVHLSMTLLRNPRGRPDGVVGYAVDLTLSKRQERELRALSERLRASNKELESFSYSVSHDLRTPLRAIDGFSLALLEDYGNRLDETAHDYLHRVRKGAQRMGTLIDDLLQLSRVNRAELHREPVELSAIAGEIIEELRATDPRRETEIVLDAPMLVDGDPRLLHAMLANLLGNAWKFTAREARARIRFMRDARRPGVFYIEDNGVGFDMRHADKLFGAFQRLHRTTDFPGTGVGLAIVQRIVHRHGGWIQAWAEEGRGACFHFTLQPDLAPDGHSTEGDTVEAKDPAAG